MCTREGHLFDLEAVVPYVKQHEIVRSDAIDYSFAYSCTVTDCLYGAVLVVRTP